jgi:hypothetical protein
MRITQNKNSLLIEDYTTPWGKINIMIINRRNCDFVTYTGRCGNVIDECFDHNGLYDCDGKKLPGEKPWLIERTGRVPYGDLCVFCKHRGCPKDMSERTFYIWTCDDYERWDE